MPSVQPFVIKPEPQAIKQHPTLSRQVRELSESYEDAASTVDDKRLQSLGGLLWEVLSLGKQLDLAKDQAGDNVLPIIIESDDGLVISLPWEALYHPEYGFLARESSFTLTRRMPKGKKSLPEPECAPLRVLLFTSLPDDLSEHARLQIEEEQAAVLQTLAAAEQEGRVQLEMPDDGRFDSFKATLQSFKPHVVYFSGHGQFDYEHHNTKAWAIFQFEDEWGKTLEVEENEIRDCLTGSDVQAVVFSACESAKSHKDYADNGLAQCLHLAGIPHVIGMRESVYDLAGIEFAKAFFAALGQAYSMDQALQQARLAIQAMPKQRSADEHWCLPAQFSQDLSQPLVDWSFELVPRGQVQSTHDSVNGISLPPKFIGRRRELREWQNALRSGEKSECLIIGAGGMGKTALAGKLLNSLKRDGYEVFGLSVRPEEAHDWRSSLSQLELLLKDEFPIKQYQTALGEATTIETPNDLEESPKVTVDEGRRAEALFDGLLRQYDRQFVLLIDNLESVQHEKTRQVNDPVLASWIEVARRFADRGLKLILTSRWQLPKWGESSLCILGQPVFADYVAFIRELSLPVRFMGNAERVRAAFEQLGGNYRALTFFAAAAQGMTLGAEQEFLEKLGQAQEEIQVDMAIEQVYEQLDESQRELLSLMDVYTYPVDIGGIIEIVKNPNVTSKNLALLLKFSLIEKYKYNEISFDEYIISPIARNYLQKYRFSFTKENVKKKASLYLYMQAQSIKKSDYLHLINTHQALEEVCHYKQSHRLVLDQIWTYLSRKSQYLEIIEIWLPPLLKSKNIDIYSEALNQTGLGYSGIDKHELAISFFNKAILEYKKIESIRNEATCLSNSASSNAALGKYETALDDFEKSLIISRKTNDSQLECTILNGMSSIYFDLCEYEKLYNCLSDALNIANKGGDLQSKYSTLHNITAYHEVKGNYNLAIANTASALDAAIENDDIYTKGILLGNIGNIYRRLGDYDKSLEYLTKSINLSNEMGFKSIGCDAKICISKIYIRCGSYEIARDHLYETLILARDIKDKRFESMSLNMLSSVFQAEGNVEKAISLAEESLVIATEYKDLLNQFSAHNALAEIYYLQEDYSTAMDHLNIVLIGLDGVKNIEEKAIILNNISITLISNKDYFTARKYLRKSIKVSKKIGAKHELLDSIFYIALSFYSEKKYKRSIFIFLIYIERSEGFDDFYRKDIFHYLIVSYIKIKEYREAKRNIGFLLRDHRSAEDCLCKATCFSNLGVIYKETNKYQHAIECFRKAKDELRTCPDGAVLSNIFFHLGDIYLKIGKIEECNRNLKESIKIAKASNAEEVLFKISELLEVKIEDLV